MCFSIRGENVQDQRKDSLNFLCKFDMAARGNKRPAQPARAIRGVAVKASERARSTTIRQSDNPAKGGGMATALVLVVDDDPEVRELAVATLKGAGYQILEAATGHHAVRLLEENSEIALIFTDIVMPGLDGFKLADMAKVSRPHIKILYATGFMHLVEEKLGVVHGRILQKPYRSAQLRDLVKQTLA
jgi:CheY-like chemotaxis protein